jgi:hypothetical protein
MPSNGEVFAMLLLAVLFWLVWYVHQRNSRQYTASEWLQRMRDLGIVPQPVQAKQEQQ